MKQALAQVNFLLKRDDEPETKLPGRRGPKKIDFKALAQEMEGKTVEDISEQTLREITAEAKKPSIDDVLEEEEENKAPPELPSIRETPAESVTTTTVNSPRGERPNLGAKTSALELTMRPINLYGDLVNNMAMPNRVAFNFFADTIAYEDGAGKGITIQEAIRRKLMGEAVTKSAPRLLMDSVRAFNPAYPQQFTPRQIHVSPAEIDSFILQTSKELAKDGTMDPFSFREITIPPTKEVEIEVFVEGSAMKVTVLKPDFNAKNYKKISYNPSYFSIPYQQSVLLFAQAQAAVGGPDEKRFATMLKESVSMNSAHNGSIHMQLNREVKIRKQGQGKVERSQQATQRLLKAYEYEDFYKLPRRFLANIPDEVRGPIDTFEIYRPRLLPPEFFNDALILDLLDPTETLLDVPYYDGTIKMNITGVNSSAASGLLFGGKKRGEVIIDEVAVLKDFWQDLGTVDSKDGLGTFLAKWSWAFVAKQKPKMEVYPVDRLLAEDKNKVRSYWEPNSFVQIPNQILNKVLWSNAQAYSGPGSINRSLMGFNLMGGGFQEIVQEIVDAEPGQTLLWYYADNLYVYSADLDAFFSYDGKTFEELRTVEQVRQYAASLYRALTKQESEMTAFGGQPKTSIAWRNYFLYIMPLLTVPFAALGTQVWRMTYMASGTNGTAYLNNLGMARVVAPMSNLLDGGLSFDKLLNMKVYDTLAEISTPEDLEMTDLFSPLGLDFMHSTGVNLKLELLVKGFKKAILLRPNSITPMDLLGFDCHNLSINPGSVLAVPVLNETRLIKTLAFPKSEPPPRTTDKQREEWELVAPLINVFKFRSLYTLGGWAYKGVASALMLLISQNLSGLSSDNYDLNLDMLKATIDEFVNRSEDKTGIEWVTDGVIRYLTNAPLIPPVSEIVRITTGQAAQDQFLKDYRAAYEAKSVDFQTMPLMISKDELSYIAGKDMKSDPTIKLLYTSAFEPFTTHVKVNYPTAVKFSLRAIADPGAHFLEVMASTAKEAGALTTLEVAKRVLDEASKPGDILKTIDRPTQVKRSKLAPEERRALKLQMRAQVQEEGPNGPDLTKLHHFFSNLANDKVKENTLIIDTNLAEITFFQNRQRFLIAREICPMVKKFPHARQFATNWMQKMGKKFKTYKPLFDPVLWLLFQHQSDSDGIQEFLRNLKIPPVKGGTLALRPAMYEAVRDLIQGTRYRKANPNEPFPIYAIGDFEIKDMSHPRPQDTQFACALGAQYYYVEVKQLPDFLSKQQGDPQISQYTYEFPVLVRRANKKDEVVMEALPIWAFKTMSNRAIAQNSGARIEFLETYPKIIKDFYAQFSPASQLVIRSAHAEGKGLERAIRLPTAEMMMKMTRDIEQVRKGDEEALRNLNTHIPKDVVPQLFPGLMNNKEREVWLRERILEKAKLTAQEIASSILYLPALFAQTSRSTNLEDLITDPSWVAVSLPKLLKLPQEQKDMIAKRIALSFYLDQGMSFTRAIESIAHIDSSLLESIQTHPDVEVIADLLNPVIDQEEL